MTRKHKDGALLSLVLILTGCGGSSGSGFGDSDALAVTIDWPSQTRGVSAPTFAMSAKMTLLAAGPNGSNLVWVGDRPTDRLATSIKYPGPKGFTEGGSSLMVEFFTNPGATGRRVAFAAAGVRIERTGKILSSEGAELPNITYAESDLNDFPSYSLGLVTRRIAVGESTPILSKATSSDFGTLVALPPQVIAYQFDPGQSQVLVNADGTVTGRQEGALNVVGRLGSRVFSGKIDIVPPTVQPSRFHSGSYSYMAFDSSRQTLWAASSSEPVVVAINPANGQILRTIDSKGFVSAMEIDPTNSVMYLGYDALRVRKVSLSDEVVPEGSMQITGTTHLRLQDIAIDPQNINRIAVTTLEGSNSGGVHIFDNGVLSSLPRLFSVPRPKTVAWVDSNTLFLGDSNYLAIRVRFENGAWNPLETSDFTRRAFGELARTSNFVYGGGIVYNPEVSAEQILFTTNPNGAISNPYTNLVGFASSSVADVANSKMFSLGRDPGFGSPTTLGAKIAMVVRAGNLSNGNPLASVSLDLEPGNEVFGGTPAGYPRFYPIVRWGAKGLAFLTARGIVFLDTAPGL